MTKPDLCLLAQWLDPGIVRLLTKGEIQKGSGAAPASWELWKHFG